MPAVSQEIVAVIVSLLALVAGVLTLVYSDKLFKQVSPTSDDAKKNKNLLMAFGGLEVAAAVIVGGIAAFAMKKGTTFGQVFQ